MHSSRVQLIERNRRNLERWRGKVPQSILPFEEERRALLQEGRLRSSLIVCKKRLDVKMTLVLCDLISHSIGLNGQNAVDISVAAYSGCSDVQPCKRKKRLLPPSLESMSQSVAWDNLASTGTYKSEHELCQEQAYVDRMHVAQFQRVLAEQRKNQNRSAANYGPGWQRSSCPNFRPIRGTAMGSSFTLPFGNIQGVTLRKGL